MLSDEERWKLVQEHKWIATGLVNQFCRRHPSFWSYQEDLLQRVRLAMYGSAKKFDKAKGGKFQHWCFSRARGSLIDFLKRYLKRQAKDTPLFFPNGSLRLDKRFCQSDQTAARITSQDEVTFIWRLLNEGLVADEYQLLHEAYTLGLPFKELAAQRGLTLPVFKGRVYRARLHAMEILESAGYHRPLGVAI